jgi:hypothetical protein
VPKNLHKEQSFSEQKRDFETGRTGKKPTSNNKRQQNFKRQLLIIQKECKVF